MVDEPQGKHFGAEVAAPAFSEMGKQLTEVLNMVPTSLPAQAVKLAVPGTPAAPAAAL